MLWSLGLGGGVVALSRIFLSAPDVSELEAKYALEAISSGWLAPAGPDLQTFERELADRVGVPHAVALSSGTAALHLALVGLGVGVGDVVITSTMTFAATANAIVYTGGEPYFVDCERETGNIDLALARAAADKLRSTGARIGALVPIDLLGKCADMTGCTALADELGVPLVVDAAESMGATYGGRPAGSFGTASVLSFNGNKIMTTSGGGALVTTDRRLAEHARYLSTQARQPVMHYEHVDIGYNYRLSNVLAAIGRAQLARLDEMLARRRAHREAYRALFADAPGVAIFGGADDAEDNCWLTSIVVDEPASWTVAELSAHLETHDIESRPLWNPMHLQPVFADARSAVNGHAQWLFQHGLTLPSGSGMNDIEAERVRTAIQAFMTGH